jgi:hypothetical protein
MNIGEHHLAALAAALAGKASGFTASEERLIAYAPEIDSSLVEASRSRILSGEDPLGTEFCLLRSPEKRRETGATYTPSAIIDAMIGWAVDVDSAPARVVEPGIGSGRFIGAAASRFPDAELIGVDIDPFALLMARANASVRGYAHRLSLHLGDYRQHRTIKMRTELGAKRSFVNYAARGRTSRTAFASKRPLREKGTSHSAGDGYHRLLQAATWTRSAERSDRVGRKPL